MASRGRERSGKGDGKAAPVVAIRVAGRDVVIDQRTLTIRERQAMRGAMASLDDPDDLDALTATIWVVLRRDEPSLTFEDVCDSLTIGDLADAAEAQPDESDPES